MIVNTKDFVRKVDHDPDPDLSFMDQDEKQAWVNGELVCIYVKAIIQIFLKNTKVTVLLESPGCYGIVVNSVDDPYVQEIFEEECKILADMLIEMGMTVQDKDRFTWESDSPPGSGI